ncbi:unnamed protein product [Ophioblennius macclurei]
MASLLRDPLFEISGQAPPPSKDFYYFSVTKTNVIWRWWKISMRTVERFCKPGQVKESFQDFLDDTKLQSQVSVVFGRRILEYSKALCQGHYNYLELLPDSLMLWIISYLELEDVGRLSQTSLRFRQLCASEGFWEQAVRQRCFTVTAEVASLSSEVGWRNIFFTNKLQLQKLISRRRLKTEKQPDELVADPSAEEAGSPAEKPGTNQASGAQEQFNPALSVI